MVSDGALLDADKQPRCLEQVAAEVARQYILSFGKAPCTVQTCADLASFSILV
jgi:hypothetical protein